MRAALHLPTNPIERHFLLEVLVETLFERWQKNRGVEAELRAVITLHINELPELLAQMSRHDEMTRASLGLHEPKPFMPPALSAFGVLESLALRANDKAGAEEAWRMAVEVGYLEPARLPDTLARVERSFAKLSKARPPTIS